MQTHHHPNPIPPASPLSGDADERLPAAAYLRYESRADGWSAGRQAACLAHLADNGIVADAVRSVGMSVGGSYALRRTARGYAFNLGWEAALIIARRIVADNLMAAAIKGERAEWVREDGRTTYVRQNTRLSLTLLDRVNPATSLPEVMAVATRFDWFLELIDKRASAAQLWELFFDDALPRDEREARERVRASLQLSAESADFDESEAGTVDEDDRPVEYKSMDGPICADAVYADATSDSVPSAFAAPGKRLRVERAEVGLSRRHVAAERDSLCKLPVIDMPIGGPPLHHGIPSLPVHRIEQDAHEAMIGTDWPAALLRQRGQGFACEAQPLRLQAGPVLRAFVSSDHHDRRMGDSEKCVNPLTPFSTPPALRRPLPACNWSRGGNARRPAR